MRVGRLDRLKLTEQRTVVQAASVEIHPSFNVRVLYVDQTAQVQLPPFDADLAGRAAPD